MHFMDHAGEDGYWAELGLLWSRATGGAGVAAAPHLYAGSKDMPMGPAAPGAEEIVEWALSSVNSKSSVSKLAFLVGGPGNGKSELTSRAVSELESIDTDSSLIAQRNYRYSLGSKELLLINDATIGLNSAKTTSLSNEINSVIRQGSNAIANVNRGILFEELNNEPEGIGKLVLNWLVQSTQPLEFVDGDYRVSLIPLETGLFLATAEIRNEDVVIASLAVCFMDSCSLLEERPTVSVMETESPNFLFESTEYSIQRFSQRKSMDMGAVPAAALLQKVVSKLLNLYPYRAMDSTSLDPVHANLNLLGNPDVQRNFLSLLRAGEIASSRLLTYRELWGSIVRVIVGSLPERTDSLGVQRFLEDQHPKDGSDPLTRFRSMMKLANYRAFQAIFGELDPDLQHVTQIDEPVTRLTHLVDPIRDVSPDWAKPIFDAFSLSTQDPSPLTDLIESVNSAHDGFDLATYVSTFDFELDRAYSAAVMDENLPDRERNTITGWYGRYITRLFAFVKGQIAFKNEIEYWTLAWHRGELPDELNNQLKTLLLPGIDADDRSLIMPVYASRTVPIIGGVTSPKLVLKVKKNWTLTPHKRGERLFVQLMEGDVQIVELELDFSLMREALACKDGHVGVTEYVHAAAPRLERFRASLLLPNAGVERSYWVLYPGGGNGERVYTK